MYHCSSLLLETWHPGHVIENGFEKKIGLALKDLKNLWRGKKLTVNPIRAVLNFPSLFEDRNCPNQPYKSTID